jgi:hypothetical protein
MTSAGKKKQEERSRLLSLRLKKRSIIAAVGRRK